MHVTGIKYAGKADVYNMEVPGIHDFAVENGAIVHNCYDDTRYFLMSRPAPARQYAPEVTKPYSPYEKRGRA